jgi:hypothetical protein
MGLPSVFMVNAGQIVLTVWGLIFAYIVNSENNVKNVMGEIVVKHHSVQQLPLIKTMMVTASAVLYTHTPIVL